MILRESCPRVQEDKSTRWVKATEEGLGPTEEGKKQTYQTWHSAKGEGKATSAF